MGQDEEPHSLSALLRALADPAGGDDPGAEGGWERALRPGLVVGRFELVREVGRGGFGVVWEARDLDLGRAVAFKALRATRRGAPHEERLLREAEVAARLSHPNIVTLFDVGRSEHGPYLILELLRGRTLAERLADGRVAPGEAVRIVLEVARGMAHAHAAGVVHRDLKPANVFLCDDGQVKVLDLGLAHAFGRPKTDGGTPAYMAPEQERDAPEDERTDVFALGAILYRLLANESPFREGRRRDAGAPALVTPQAPGLAALVARMLERDPVRRPRDGGEVAAALEGLRRELQDAPAAGRPVRRRRGVPRRLACAIRDAAIVTAIAGAAAFALSPALRGRVVGRLAGLGRTLPAEKTIAVLPFRAVGGAREDDAFSAGLSELLTNRLRQLEEFRSTLRVVSSGEVLREKVASAKDARLAFGATLALEGSVHWEPDAVRVDASLVDARTQLVLSASDLVVPRADLAGLGGALVARVAEMLHLEGPPGPGAAVPSEPPPAPGAYAFYLQGRGYLQRYDRAENLESAVAVFDEALRRDPGYALAHAGRAEAELRRFELTKDPRHLAAARASVGRAVELAGGLAPVALTLGLVHMAAGEHGEAIRAFERALEAEPASADALRELARAEDAAGRVEQAEATYRRAIELRPSSWAAYKDLGVFYNRHGRLTEALPLFERVVALTPDNYAGYANLGGLYLRLGMHERAVATLKRSLALKPTAPAWANLGSVHFYEGRYADAAGAYRKAAELNPGDARLWGALGDAERWAGRADDAARDYGRAIVLLEQQLGINPSDAGGWSLLAVNESARGDRARALEHVGRALELDAASGQVRFRAALVFEEAGQRARALDAVRGALAAGYSREEIGNAPPLAALRRDPRYAALAERP